MISEDVPLLSVRGLSTSFSANGRKTGALSDLSFELARGETLGLVGESGSGKSLTALAILGLLPDEASVFSGSITLEGREILHLPESAWCKIRGARIGMIFQEPMTSLNPVYSIGAQIMEAIRLHRTMTRKEARREAISLLTQVGIPSPETTVDSFPHELSGGQRQRAMIAMAISCRPALLLADEPTTALDVTVQAQILDLLTALQKSHDMGLLLITHDLGVVRERCDRVAVMYAGTLVEEAPRSALFSEPLHPYTRGLIASVPGQSAMNRGERHLVGIPGNVPNLGALPRGCRFSNRCPDMRDQCLESEPKLITLASGRRVRCLNHTA